ncbi:MAG: hypothetical protein U0531_19985 [Dehalococcoidia bacterium]
MGPGGSARGAGRDASAGGAPPPAATGALDRRAQRSPAVTYAVRRDRRPLTGGG